MGYIWSYGCLLSTLNSRIIKVEWLILSLKNMKKINNKPRISHVWLLGHSPNKIFIQIIKMTVRVITAPCLSNKTTSNYILKTIKTVCASKIWPWEALDGFSFADWWFFNVRVVLGIIENKRLRGSFDKKNSGGLIIRP